MHSSRQAPEQLARCPICRAEVPAGVEFCETCGSRVADAPVQELHNLNFLLSELSRWEEEGFVNHEQASALRESYERRREDLRARLAAGRKQTGPPATAQQDASRPALERQNQPPAAATKSRPPAHKPPTPRRALLETLADPQTIRILLYTGAAMLVVGVVIWLRDILYLKLREPIVQATLLMTGTIIVTVCGWLTILRTRLRLTGRALTLTGSLLIPVNFWFLVRSGLIENNGRAWLVCAFCAALYALTAAFLREQLYVYLASVAVICTAWTLIYQVEREAFGLYALSLTTSSLIFLHLSRLFPALTHAGRLTIEDEQTTADSQASALGHHRPPLLPARTSRELWSLPLVRVALSGVSLGLLLYMPLRTGSQTSFADGLFRLRSGEYDPGIAMLLSAAVAYAAWFTGRDILTEKRVTLYTASALALFWTEFLAVDGLRISGASQLLLLSATALLAALTARVLKSEAWALALHHASLALIVVLAILTYPVISVTDTPALAHSLILFLIISTYAISGSSRKSLKGTSENPAHVFIAFGTTAIVVLQAIVHLRVGDPALLMPALVLGIAGLLLFGATLRLKDSERVRYFRAGLFALVTAFTLAALHAGLDPFGEMEIYTSPVGLMLLVVAYFYARREEGEYAADTKLLLWAGSLLLAAPLLLHALQYRLFLDVPAAWRDLATLCAALALLIFGIVRRLRAPVLTGAASLTIELSALALTSVGWLQIPLKVYLISTGALILLVWGLLEFRHEQILLIRKRFNERRDYARERFGEWK